MAIPAEWGKNNKEPRQEFDEYPTPAAFTNALLDREDFVGTIYEPAAGGGHMVQALRDRGEKVEWDDLQRTGKDFLKCEDRHDNIVTNPPYKYAQLFVEKALELAEHKVAVLMKNSFLEGVNRGRLFNEHPPTDIYMTTRRMKTPSGSGIFTHSWIVWNIEFPVLRGNTRLTWFAPQGDIVIPIGNLPGFEL